MKSNTKFKNFDLLINELENKKSVFNDFDFTKSIKSYKDQFGLDSMSFLFVEELNDINSESIAKLSNLLNVDKKLIFNLINDKKNVQIKKDQTTKSTLKSEGLIKIWHFYNNNLRFLRPIIKNFNFLKDSYKLESLTDHQKEKIFNLYQDHNKDFAKEYDLRESMKRLNYY